MKYYGLSHKYQDQTKWKSNDYNFKNKFSFLGQSQVQGQITKKSTIEILEKKYRFSVYEASVRSSHKDQDQTRN